MKTRKILDSVDDVLKAYSNLRASGDDFPFLGNRKLEFYEDGSITLENISEPHIDVVIENVDIMDLFYAMADKLNIQFNLSGRKIVLK